MTKPCQVCTDYTLEFGSIDASDDSNVRRIVLRAFCKRCGTPQRFIGIDHGIALERPCTSTDGLTVFIPMVNALEDVEHGRRLNA